MLCYVTHAFCSLSHPHILVSTFKIAFWFFQQQFFLMFQHSTDQLFTYFMFQHFLPGFLWWLLQQFLGLCHALCSTILSLCNCYLTMNNFMLTFCTYEIWDTIFMQFILIFVEHVHWKRQAVVTFQNLLQIDYCR